MEAQEIGVCNPTKRKIKTSLATQERNDQCIADAANEGQIRAGVAKGVQKSFEIKQ